MKNFLYRIQDKMRTFMIGRYGVDQLYIFNTYFLMVLLILNLFIRNRLYNVVVLAFIIFNIYRPFSKNHSARYKENQIFLNIKGKVISYFRLQSHYRVWGYYWRRVWEYRFFNEKEIRNWTASYLPCLPMHQIIIKIMRRQISESFRRVWMSWMQWEN